MRPLLAFALCAAACHRRAPTPPVEKVDPSIPRPAPTGALAAPPASPPAEPRGLIGPKGTLGVDVYRARRRALLERMKAGGALVAAGWNEEFDRVGSDFYYLTGIEEKGAALLLAPQAPTFKEVLYLARLDPERERVEGERAPIPSRALELATGIGRIGRERNVGGALVHACAAWGSLVYLGDFIAPPAEKPAEMALYRDAEERTFNCRVVDMHGAIARLREIKSPEELALMRKAIQHTAAGHATALKVVRPGVSEWTVKEAIEEAFRHDGARDLSYDSITGSGPNGAVLHYRRDARVMKEGEVIVIDAAADHEHYASDVTRTLPIGGRYTPEQRQIYDLVLRAQAAGIAKAKAGVTIEEIDLATRKVIEEGGYYDAYLHGCCHFVGLDVHDAGDYDAPLPAGAVITVEPGIYLGQRGFGVRIEDMILITPTGAELLTAAIPRDPDEIERLMHQSQ